MLYFIIPLTNANNLGNNCVIFNKDERHLLINIGSNPVKLELPYLLALDMIKLAEQNPSTPLLFVNEKASQLTTSYFELTRVRKYAAKFQKENPNIYLNPESFTLEGMAKFGVINLLIAGMNPILVERLTGAKENVLLYCQKEAIKMLARGSENSINNYFNSRIRSVTTFDDWIDKKTKT